MALTSPGVQVSVIDESFYTPAEPGTRPLFVVVSAANKTNASGTGTAQGTLAANVGKVYTVTSQRELADMFGDPVFRVDSNKNPIHAGELNEYGLQAAYSFLGVSNSALVVRADIDLNELTAQAEAPVGKPVDGTIWLDTDSTSYGIFEWNAASEVSGGQVFVHKTPAVYSGMPANTKGAVGSYAVVTNVVGEENTIAIYYKSPYTESGLAVAASGTWVKVGTSAWAAAWPVVSGTPISTSVPLGVSGSIAIQVGETVASVNIVADLTTVGDIVTELNAEAGLTPAFGARVVSTGTGSGKFEIFARNAAPTSISVIADDAVLTALGLTVDGDFATPAVEISKHTQVPQWKGATVNGSGRPTGSVWIKTTVPNSGASWIVKTYNKVTQLWTVASAPLYANNAAATIGIDPSGAGANIAEATVYIQYDFNNRGSDPKVAEFRGAFWFNKAWALMDATNANQYYAIRPDAPSTLAANNALWYSSVVDEVDFLVLDVVNGKPKWVGLNNHSAYAESQVFVTATQPALSSAQKLVNNHLWVDTSDLENYPNLKRWNSSFKKWFAVDVSDQTTENGILFADARAGISGGTSTTAPVDTLSLMRTSDFVDFDAPDPALYPQGMLLWNLRRSGFNVKQFRTNYVDTTKFNLRVGGKDGQPMETYYPHRWVTVSGNQSNGAGSFGRHAQRKVIVQSLQALVNSNDEIRDTERNGFNLLACPGYPELIGELVKLNYDRGLTAFVVGDTPARLPSDATSINNWGKNAAGSLQDDDNGLATSDEYLGVFYPWGFTSDNAGNDIAVPPSHMILRMIALNDQVAYPWFAPAGTRRGGITNATAVGYVTAEGEFKSVALNESQRDTLYNVKVNPITFFVGAGLVNFGQKTRARNASALDRINVARLVIHLRSQLNKLAKPYIFEPNDKITRDEIKQQVESLLLELVGQRALYDFLVVCDESNNTPNRIDRNELYVDIAIEPVKAVEFIYIPVRLKNTGEIAGL